MSNSLSIRKQERFVTAFNNLIDSDRVHKKDINQINSIVNKLSKVEVSRALLYSMGASAQDPHALKYTFSNLFSKLATQNSGMYKEKYAKLENIHSKLTSFVNDVHNLKIKEQINILDKKINHVSARINSAHDEIRSCQENIAVAGNMIYTMKNELIPLESVLERTSDAEFAALDAQHTVEPPNIFRDHKSHYDSCLLFLEYGISEQKRCKNALVNLANEHYVDIEQDLRKAELGEVRSDGISWDDYMTSESYAMEKFGSTILANAPTPELSSAGKEWQTLMDNFNRSFEKINNAQLEKESLREGLKSAIMEKVNMSARERVIDNMDINKYWTFNFEYMHQTEWERLQTNEKIITALENRKEGFLNQKSILSSQII